jgi:hypothetical protein
MRKFLMVLTLALLTSSSAAANPFTWTWHWAGHHKRGLLMEGAALGAAGWHAAALHHCRTGNVEVCDEGYGSAWAMYGFLTGVTVVALPAVAEACWRATDDDRGCYAIAYGGSAFQAGLGGFNWAARREPEDHACRLLRDCKPRPEKNLFTIRW